jgi:4-hydroxythreonine-4-phosphate dehydrogenase
MRTAAVRATHAGGVLVIVGSMSSVSHAQADALAEQAGTEILACSIDATSLLDPMSTAPASWRNWSRRPCSRDAACW